MGANQVFSSFILDLFEMLKCQMKRKVNHKNTDITPSRTHALTLRFADAP